MDVVLFVGLQGSGKSTFYRTHFASTHVLISKDLFRSNRRPQQRQMHLIDEALRAGKSIVVDNTNPTVEDRAPIVSLARSHGANVIGFYFDSPFEECLERNRGRAGKQRVPDRALYITAKRMSPPNLEEGFDHLFRVNLNPSGEFVTGEIAEGGER